MPKAHYAVDKHDNKWVILADGERVLTTDTRRHAATIARSARELLKCDGGKTHSAPDGDSPQDGVNAIAQTPPR